MRRRRTSNMASTTGMATSRDVLISLYSKAKFLSNQPEGWIADKDTGKLRCFNDAVSVFVHREEKRILGDKNVVQITSLADLDVFMERVRSKPVVTTALCSKPYTHDRDRYNDESANHEHLTHTEEYIAMINTNHPQVQSMFQEAYEKTKRLIEQGKKFRVTISLSESIKTWFIHNVPMPNQGDSVTYAINCDMYLVNGAKEPTFADRCFSCDVITQKVFWCVCFPFFLLCFVPYCVYKKFVV